ncbi:MAG: hypothetical protein IBJ13_14535, partial [Sphingopyxis sp.]|nr:hypothetical protein [Sphingopyxis sp.]
MSGAELTRRGLLAGGLGLAVASAASARTYVASAETRVTVNGPVGPYVGSIGVPPRDEALAPCRLCGIR